MSWIGEKQPFLRDLQMKIVAAYRMSSIWELLLGLTSLCVLGNALRGSPPTRMRTAKLIQTINLGRHVPNINLIGRACNRQGYDIRGPLHMSATPVDAKQRQQKIQGHDDDDTDLNILFDDDDENDTVNADDTLQILTPEAYRREHNINLKGEGANEFVPWVDFEDTPYSSTLLKAIEKAGYVSPTSIQAQSWPIALSQRDLISVARTGSGKTCGFLLPALHSLMQNRQARRSSSVKEVKTTSTGERRRTYSVRRNPSVLVLAPTRELAVQIEQEAQKFTRAAGVYSTCLYGGTPKGPQIGMLRRGVDIIVATPGRCNDLAEMGILNLADVKYLVLDEADRMLDMGFEPQIRTILGQCAPDRQSLFFTATWPREVRSLAADYLNNPIQIQIGDLSGKLTANKAIEQNIVMIEEYDKYDRLMDILEDINDTEDKNPRKVPKTIVFLSRKSACDDLAYDLRKQGYYVDSLHGDKSQNYRQIAMDRFRNNRLQVLIATDVAARGLDVKDINTVINYDFPVGTSGVEDYVHRIGRTGRGENKGRSYTFFTRGDRDRADELCGVLKRSEQEVPKTLEAMCRQRRNGGGRGRGGGGRGYNGGGGRRRGGEGGGYGRGRGSSYRGGGGPRAYSPRNGGNGGEGRSYSSGAGRRESFGVRGADRGGAYSAGPGHRFDNFD